MADQSVGPTYHQTSQSRADAEESPYAEKANKTKNSPERHQDQPRCGPRHIPRRPAQIDNLGIGINISDPDRDAGSYRVIPHFRVASRQRNPKNDQMLQDVNPVCDREGGCQEKEDYQFCEGDAEQEEIGKPSPKHFRDVRDHLRRSASAKQKVTMGCAT